MALNLNDQSTNGNTLTNNGATEYASSFPYASITEAAQLVRASSQYLTAVKSTSLEITGALSIGMWVRLASLPAAGQLYMLASRYSGSNDSTSAYFAQLQNVSGTYYIQFGTLQGTALDVANTTSYTPITNAWHHYGFTYDGNKNYKFFVDNVQQGSTVTLSNTAINVGTQDLYIGEAPAGGANYFDGQIADVRIYSEAHNWSDYNALVSPTQANLNAWWPFQLISSSLVSSGLLTLGVGA